MDQYIGKMLDDRYEIIELIGNGGMANVYKAKCHRLNRMVAVKILKSDLAEDAEFRRRFYDESQAVAQLSHTNIVSVYDVSSNNDMEYIVMELIDGITLKQYIERRGQMDWREALHFITQIMRGLDHAHSRGIIHRDIKPQNIMVLRDGSVKVADFGIACLANSGQTLTQEALGSVHYISPEQARGERTDARSDIYSAGVVLYEMLTGRLPFEGDSAVSVAIQHLSSVPLAPRDINENVPEALELICMKAMNPNIEKRYTSAEMMLADLEKFRKDPSINLDYIRTQLKEEENTEPTQAIPAAEVAAIAKKRSKKAEGKKVQEPTSEEAEAEKKNKKLMYCIIGGFAAALVAVFVIFQLILGGFGGDNNGDIYEVPNVVGLTVEEAQELEGVKDVFEIQIIGTRDDSEFEAGQILEQDPKPGHKRKSNLVIGVYVCAEKELYYMPTLSGTDLQQAKLQLKEMNLDLNITSEEQYSDQYKEGQVISTEPASGTEIHNGDTIKLIVSKGPETKQVTVISFTGMSLDSATSKAEDLGLKVGSTDYAYSDAPEGEVIDQSLSVGDTVDEGTKIAFTVSKGHEDTGITVPGFVGNSIESAISEAKDVGLAVGNTNYAYSDAPEGQVIEQSLSKDSKVDKGTTITFTVSKGEEPAKSVTKEVAFDVPSEYQGEVKVEFIRDGSVISTVYNDGGKVSCIIEGLEGSSTKIEARFTGATETSDSYQTSQSQTVNF